MIVGGVLDGLALLLAPLRLWIRFRMKRLWWEDAWAAVAFVCGVMFLPAEWVYLQEPREGAPTATSMWIYMIVFTFVVWAVRISIILSIVRIIPPRERLRTWGLLTVVVFLLLCVAFLVQKVKYCFSIYKAFVPATPTSKFSCFLPRQITIFEVAADVFADLIAVVLPLQMLRKIKLPSKRRRLLRSLFSSSIAVSFVCAVRAMCQVIDALESFIALIDAFQFAVCLTVCNLLVIVTYFYHVLGYTIDDSDSTTEEDTPVTISDNNTPSSTGLQTAPLTTVELDFSNSMGTGTGTGTGFSVVSSCQQVSILTAERSVC
ncbi:hypothetical protein HYDPIDRAFT_114696 [Hydnomerulius pinastri MD-312]|uniref:Unplaced genomic scaffold scaffold_22, whole genome shotgun sequence n=1 Tax=Hydnomerulius pinastri MD-312 TaxID=994086 RepID=A0A0C9VVT0_9AGAM|nr:hypothetical protein HYDPIDRAFT_114696 [Hydnomerulius pinastri MD-312]